ncbi:MAG: hypothetical protein JXQ87_10245 [Bacteroidia bacterium]
MIRFSSLILFVLAFSIVFGQDQASQSSNNKGYLLKYEPAVGTKGKMNMSIDMSMEMEMPNISDVEVKQIMTMASSLSIISQNTRTTTSKMEYDYITVKQDNSMAGVVNYDSRNPDLDNYMAKALHDGMSNLLDSTFITIQDKTSKIVQDPGERGTGLASTRQGSGAATDATSAMSMSVFPKEPIKVGYSWTETIDNENTYMGITTTYTLVSVENGVVKIQADGKYFLNTKFTGEVSPTDLSGTQSGYSYYRLSDMWLLKSNMVQDYTMTMNSAGMETKTKTVSKIDIVVE